MITYCHGKMSLYTEWKKMGYKIGKEVCHSKYIFNNYLSSKPDQEIYCLRGRELGYMLFILR